jgi:hypothetical protein
MFEIKQKRKDSYPSPARLGNMARTWPELLQVQTFLQQLIPGYARA